jgi:hypothetical protein
MINIEEKCIYVLEFALISEEIQSAQAVCTPGFELRAI